MASAASEAEMAVEVLESYAAQVEDGERQGDLAALLAADAIALALREVAEAIRETRPV